MSIFRKILTTCSLFAVIGFAQQAAPESVPATQDSATADALDWDSTPTTVDPNATATPAQDSTEEAWPTDTTAVADSAATDSAQVADSTATEEADKALVKPRNKITYAEYQAKVKATAKKRSRTLHHGLTIMDANFQDSRYGNMKEDAEWGSGIGLYYFYRRYYGHYLGFQGRLGVNYRYSRWNFDLKHIDGKTSDGVSYEMVHNIDRKYHNFAADLPLTLKLGHHIKKTTGFIFMSATLDITKPIYEMVDTENRLYLESFGDASEEELERITKYGDNPFPLYESHQTNKSFGIKDWETSGWLGLGVESRLVSVEFQVYGIGTSTSDNHRYHHIGHDSNFTWRLFVDFSIR